MTGQLTLIAGDTYPAPPESTNPANNISRWFQGQTVWVDYTNDAGSLVPHPLANPAYLLEIPNRPYFGDSPPTLTLSIGCQLALYDFTVEDTDQTGVVAGTASTTQAIVTALLNAAGITSLSLTALTGSYTAPPIKQNRSSYVVQAGQIAFAANCYLFQNSSGAIEARAIDLSPSSASFSRTVGSNEVLYRPDGDRSDPPTEEVTVSGVLVGGTTPPSGTENPYFDETITTEGEVGDVIPDAANPKARVDVREVRTRKFAYSSEANQEQDLINESLARGFIDATDPSPLSLIEARVVTAVRVFDLSERLITDTVTKTALKGLINTSEPSATKFDSVTESIATTTIVFGDSTGEAVTQNDEIRSRRYQLQQCKIITNPLESADPYELHTAIDNLEEWARQTDTDRYSYNLYPRQSNILIDSTEISDPYPLRLVPEFDARADTTNPPPQATYRTGDSSITETQIEAKAEFDFSSTFTLKRVHVLPYLQSEQTAQTIAQTLGELAAAKWLAWSGHFALTDDVMSSLAPLIRCDWTEPDNNTVGYVIDGLALEYDESSQIGAAILLPTDPGVYQRVISLEADQLSTFDGSASVPASYSLIANQLSTFGGAASPPVEVSLEANQLSTFDGAAIPN